MQNAVDDTSNFSFSILQAIKCRRLWGRLILMARGKVSGVCKETANTAKDSSVTGERIWGYTVKWFELPPNCTDLPPNYIELPPVCVELPPFQLLSPKANLPFTSTKPFFHLQKACFALLTRKTNSTLYISRYPSFTP